MDKTRNKTLVRNYINNVLNTGDTSKISEYLNEDYSEYNKGRLKKIGIKGAIDHVTGVRETYPDLKLTIDKQFCEGEWVVTCYTMTGTHKGEWMGITPTGKKIEVTGVNINKIVNGKIAEHGGATNLLEPLLKINAVKAV